MDSKTAKLTQTMSEMLAKIPMTNLQDYYICHFCGNFTRYVRDSSFHFTPTLSRALCCSWSLLITFLPLGLRLCRLSSPALSSPSDLAAHFEDEKHPFGHHCPDPSCAFASAHSPADETLFEHFLRAHHSKLPNMPVTVMALFEDSDCAAAETKAEADANASTATKAAFVAWLGLHGKAAHPTAAGVKAKVMTYTELFLKAYRERVSKDHPDPELGKQLT